MYAENRGALTRSRVFKVRRREPRYVSSVQVTLRRFLRFGPVVTRGLVLDISVRGMSALVCGMLQVGETVVIELPLPNISVEMLARVRHSSDAKSGFEFYPLSSMAQEGIQDFIRRLKQHEESMFPYAYSSAIKAGSG